MAPKRKWLKFNIPLFLDFVVATYWYLSAFFFHGSLLLALSIGGMTLWSLHSASLMHPGPIRSWTLPEFAEVCNRCSAARPRRAHHCRRCDECVARFDHHCFWIDNCVGAQNLRAFVLFLVYILLCIAHYFCEMWTFYSSLCFVSSPSCPTLVTFNRWFVWNTVFVLLYTTVVVPCALLAMMFFIQTVARAVQGITTYEEHVRGDPRWIERAAAVTGCSGIRRNLRISFGRWSWCSWWMPLAVDAWGEDTELPTSLASVVV